MVLIPKGNTDTWGIGLLDTLWKVVEALIDTCLSTTFQLYNILRKFRVGRGTGTNIMELNLAQDIAIIDHNPLFLVSLYIRNTYSTVDR